MTPHTPIPPVLRLSLDLAARGLPMLPLRAGKLPVGNCPTARATGAGDAPT